MRKISSQFEAVACVLAVLALWQSLSMTEILPSPELPSPTQIAVEFLRQTFLPKTWGLIALTLGEAALGLLLAVMIGVPIGMLLGGSKALYRLSVLLVEILRPLPAVAVIPLLILLYGIGPTLAVTLVFIAAVWPLMINSLYGVRDVDPLAIETARVYGLSGWQRYIYIIAPSAAPYIASGLRLASTYALIVAIAASLVVGGEGLGSQIARAADSAQYATMYALVCIASTLGLILVFTLNRLERRVLHWHHGFREAR